MSVHFVDEFEDGFGWIESERMQRTSHALVVDGRVWLTDPIEATASRSASVLSARPPA